MRCEATRAVATASTASFTSHNLSAISQRGIKRVLERSQREHVCVTYTRRLDGTLITRWDTIVDSIFSPIRRGFAWLVAVSVPIVLSACQTQNQLTGSVGPACKTATPKKTAAAEVERVIVTGGVYVGQND
jgi:hypothetical protein